MRALTAMIMMMLVMRVKTAKIMMVSNIRPIGVNKYPGEDGSYKVILMGQSNKNISNDTALDEHMRKSVRYKLIQ